MSEVNTILTNMDDFKELQQRLNHDSIKYQFRSKLIGGLNEEDVTEYIENIEAKLRNSEQENNRVLNEIFSLREILNREIQDKNKLQESLDDAQTLSENSFAEITQMKNKISQMYEEKEELKKQLNDSNLNIEHLSGYEVEFEENNNLLKLKITDLEKENSYIPQLKNKINQMTENQENLEKQLSESNLKFERVMDYAVKFEEENTIMKTKITDLEQENSEILQLKNKILQITNEKEELEKQLSESKIEIEQINKYDDWLKENNDILKTKTTELEQELSSNKLQNAEIDNIYQDLVNQIDIEKSTNEKLSAELELYEQNIVTLQDTIEKNTIIIEELRKISENSEQELNSEKAKLSSYKISGFKDELASIYKQIEILSEDLEQHVKINNELKQSLQSEQLRANKAENNLDSLSKLVSSLKDELNNEQNLIEAQFKQIFEKRNKFQSNIDDCLLSLV